MAKRRGMSGGEQGWRVRGEDMVERGEGEGIDGMIDLREIEETALW